MVVNQKRKRKPEERPASLKQKELYQRLCEELIGCMEEYPQDFEYKLKEALQQGFPIDYRRKGGDTLLMQSVHNASFDETSYTLLKYGADPNAANRGGSRALDAAVLCGRSPELIDRLIGAGADVNARDASGQTAFSRAAHKFIYGGFVCSTGGSERFSNAAQEYGMTAAKMLLVSDADPYLCSEWTKPVGGETEEERSGRQKLAELCDAYIAVMGEDRLQETKRDLDSFER